ncbi:MAG: hypothetical protein OXF02_06725 [Simkaniaceae bacterium]|nr:hypothetical protein [Simkaniaceae bacterium]
MKFAVVAGAVVGFLLGMIKTHIDMAREMTEQENERVRPGIQMAEIRTLLLEQNQPFGLQQPADLPHENGDRTGQ